MTISARSTVSASERDGALVVRYKNTDIVEGDDALKALAGAPVRIVVHRRTSAATTSSSKAQT